MLSTRSRCCCLPFLGGIDLNEQFRLQNFARHYFFPFFFLPPVLLPVAAAACLVLAFAADAPSSWPAVLPCVKACTLSRFLPRAFSFFCNSWSRIEGRCRLGIQRSSAGVRFGSKRFRGRFERDLGKLSLSSWPLAIFVVRASFEDEPVEIGWRIVRGCEGNTRVKGRVSSSSTSRRDRAAAPDERDGTADSNASRAEHCSELC